MNDIYYSSLRELNQTNIADGIAKIGFTVGELELLRTTSRILSSFSLAGLVFVHFVFWFFKNIRTFAFELVAWLSFSCFFFNLTALLPVYDSDDLKAMENKTLSTSCTLQSFLNIYFDLSTMLWTMIIGYTAYISVSKEKHLEENKMTYRICFVVLAYLIPLIFSLVVLFTQTYGPSGVFCWIATQANTPGTKTLTILYYIFTWSIILLNSFFVIKLILQLREELKSERELVDKYTRKLRLYPLVQIVSYIPCTINRIYNLSSGGDNFYLMMSQIILDSLTGLMFSFVYGFNASVKKNLSECCTLLCCKKKTAQKEIEDKQRSRVSHSSTFLEESFSEL